MSNRELLPAALKENLPAQQTPAFTPKRKAMEEAPEGVLPLLQLLIGHKRLLLACAILGALAGLVVSLAQPPMYKASATVEIQQHPSNYVGLKDAEGSNADMDTASIETYVRILQSWGVRKRVVLRLLAEQHTLTFRPSWLSRWSDSLGLHLPLQQAAPDYQKVLAVTSASVKAREAGQSRILEVSCESTDPKMAAVFANGMAEEFIKQNMEARWEAAQQASEFLSGQLEEVRKKLTESQHRLQSYAQSANLLFTSEKDTVAEQKLTEMQAELSKAQEDLAAKQSLYETFKAAAPPSLAEGFDLGEVHTYEAQLSDLRRQLADVSASFTPEHYKVKHIQAQIAEVENTIARERQKVASRIEAEYRDAVRKEQLLAAAYAGQASVVSEQARKSIEYSMLKKELDANQQLYVGMLQKVKELGISSTMQASNLRVLDSAMTPREPYQPQPQKTTSLGLITGLFVGIGLVYVRQSTNRYLKAPGDGPTYLRLPELGVIPCARADLARPGQQLGRMAALWRLGKGNGVTSPTEAVELASWQRKPSLLAESFRTTLTSILFSDGQAAKHRVVVMTSPSAGEGKSTVSSNLAIALAEINQRVLLIDADMRRPRLHEIHDVANAWGLSNLLQETGRLADAPVEALARKTRVPNLYLLPSGPACENISQLLFSPRLRQLIERFRKDFDTVLIDTCPLLAFSDARILARAADCAILVLRARRSKREDATVSLERLAEDGVPVLGMILNDWDPIKDGNGLSHSYYSYIDVKAND
jgi:polysaccharide biosynthesis transport protein